MFPAARTCLGVVIGYRYRMLPAFLFGEDICGTVSIHSLHSFAAIGIMIDNFPVQDSQKLSFPVIPGPIDYREETTCLWNIQKKD